MAEAAPFLGISGFFGGDSDPRAPHFRALDWIWEHSGLAGVELAADQRAVVLIDLADASALLAVVPRGDGPAASTRRIVGGQLAEVLEAGAALAALYPLGQIPRWFDHGGDLARIVAFLGGDRQVDLLAAWSALRGNADSQADRL